MGYPRLLSGGFNERRQIIRVEIVCESIAAAAG